VGEDKKSKLLRPLIRCLRLATLRKREMRGGGEEEEEKACAGA